MEQYKAAADRYGEMKYRRCGRTGLMLPAVSLGLWHNFGGTSQLETMRAMIRTAFDLGITHFDLANNYGPPPGSAEENFGRILKADLRGHRDELIVSSKAGYLMWPGPYGEWGSKKNLVASLDQSLSRLGLDYVDIFYSHRPDPDTPLEETMEALDLIRRQGKALYVGVSSYDAETTLRASAILGGLGTKLCIHQPSYSMLNRWVEDGLLAALDQEGIGSIAFCPLAQGMLTDKYLDGIPAGSRAASASVFLKEKDVTGDKVAKVRKLAELARSRGQSTAQMALAWVLREGGVTSALIGASRPEQIVENAAALSRLDFSASELGDIDRILK